MTSSIYNGTVIHKRFKPKTHFFKYNVFSLFIDLSELDQLDKTIKIFSYNKFNLVSFYEKDHGNRDGSSLIMWVKKNLEDNNINSKDIKVKLLCYPRILGYVFNPLSVFYIYDINEKIITRHPHIFSNNSDDQISTKQKWELNKKKQKNRDSILDGIPNSLSPLIVSHRLQDKSAAVGFEWESINQVISKIDEELDELKLGIINKDQSNIEEEIGDLLITIVNLSRFLNISSELALKKANKKFYRRFTNLEKLIFLMDP